MFHYLITWEEAHYTVWWSIVPVIVFMLAMFATLVWAIRHVQHTDDSTTSFPRRGGRSSARAEHLLWRFASGEIDATECRRRLDALQHRTAVPPHRLPDRA